MSTSCQPEQALNLGLESSAMPPGLPPTNRGVLAETQCHSPSLALTKPLLCCWAETGPEALS